MCWLSVPARYRSLPKRLVWTHGRRAGRPACGVVRPPSTHTGVPVQSLLARRPLAPEVHHTSLQDLCWRQIAPIVTLRHCDIVVEGVACAVHLLQGKVFVGWWTTLGLPGQVAWAGRVDVGDGSHLARGENRAIVGEVSCLSIAPLEALLR